MGTERELRQARMVMESLCSGCSAFAWETMDGRHLWGRNFDFNRLAEGSKVTYIPREMKFYTCGTELEGTLEEDTCQVTDYAAVGTGVQIFPSTPVLYEGINERGLMGGQLYYREFAHFGEGQETGRLRLQPPFAVTYFLAKCATVEEVAEKIEREVQFGKSASGNGAADPLDLFRWDWGDHRGGARPGWSSCLSEYHGSDDQQSQLSMAPSEPVELCSDPGPGLRGIPDQRGAVVAVLLGEWGVWNARRLVLTLPFRPVIFLEKVWGEGEL